VLAVKILAGIALVVCVSAGAQQPSQLSAEGTPASTGTREVTSPNLSGTENSERAACSALRNRGSDFGRLAAACDHALALPRTLPDLVFIERAERRFLPKKKTDVISAEVTFEKMHSHYADVTVNGKSQGSPFMSGTDYFAEQVTSTGEFAHLFNVFSESSQTDFAPPVNEVIGRRRATRYDFRVKRENNTGWTWFFVRSAINPAYHGSVYLDESSGEVVRLTLQVTSAEVDATTPISEATTTLEYADVVVGTAGMRHVPVRGENLSCFRGLLGCVELKLMFSNFHLFRTDTRIVP
jgi:hypothetical protein